MNEFPGSKILGKLNWEVNVVPKDAEGSEAQAETCRKTPQSEMEGIVEMQ